MRGLQTREFLKCQLTSTVQSSIGSTCPAAKHPPDGGRLRNQELVSSPFTSQVDFISETITRAADQAREVLRTKPDQASGPKSAS